MNRLTPTDVESLLARSGPPRGNGAHASFDHEPGRQRSLPVEFPTLNQQKLALAEASLESTADAVVVVDLKGRISLVNQRFSELWHLGADATVGGEFETLSRRLAARLRNGADLLARVNQASVEPGAVLRCECDAADGRSLECESQPQMLQGAVLGRVWRFRDVTEKNKTLSSLAMRNLELLTLDRLTELALRHDSAPELAGSVARELNEATGYPVVLVERFDAARGKLILLGAVGEDMTPGQEPPEFALEESISGRAIERNEPVVEPAAADEKALHHPALKGREVQTLVSVPMHSHGTALGCLTLAHPLAVGVSPGFLSWLATLASHAGVVIQHALNQEAMRHSEQRLRLAMEATADGLWEWDWNAGRFLWSARCFSMLGFDADAFEVTHQRFLDLVHPDERETTWRELRGQAAGPGGCFEVQFRLAGRDGGWRTILSRGKVIKRQPDGRPLRLIGTHVDLTDMHRAEVQLREQAELLEVAHDAIVMEDLSGQVRFWNPAAERITGWTRQEAQHQPLARLLDDGGTGALRQALQTTLETGRWNGEIRVAAKGGRVLVLETRWSLVRDNVGRPSGVLTVSTDVTENRRLESLYLRAQRMESIGTLASGVAHDLNNVLSPIIMGLEEIEIRLKDTSFRALLHLMKTSALRGADTVKQLLAFARGAEGQRGVLDLRPLLKELVRLLQQTFPKNIVMDVDAPREAWPVRGDPAQLHQVLMNLCINARDAMPNGGRLRLGLRNVTWDAASMPKHPKAVPGTYVALEVADTGTGIPPEIADRIFDPFFTTKPAGKGTGLGLWTTTGIVENHGGFLTLDSHPGQGTRFTICLPALPQQRAAGEPAAVSTVAPGAGELILVVDDEKGVRDVVSQVLVMHGYKCKTADGGQDAQTLLARHRGEFTLALIDLVMPGVSGVELARELRTTDPDLQIVFMSGMPPDSYTSDIQALQVSGFLTKPFTHQTLLSTIEKITAPAR